MILGRVFRRRARVPLAVRAGRGRGATHGFVLDTGFDGFLTLSAHAIASLSLPFLYQIPASLADASSTLLDVHEATVVWDQADLIVEVLTTGNEPLLGMRLLDGYDVRLQVTDGGLVQIESLTP